MADNRPPVSVSMPVHNGEKRTWQAMDSLLAPDYENSDLIISDNPSTDSASKMKPFSFLDVPCGA